MRKSFKNSFIHLRNVHPFENDRTKLVGEFRDGVRKCSHQIFVFHHFFKPRVAHLRSIPQEK